MLYYRTQKTQGTKVSAAKKGLVVFGTAVWLSWFLCEVPLPELAHSRASSPDIIVTEGKIPLSVTVESQEPASGDGVFTQPAVGVLTSPYGERWGRNHEGIDIGGEDGSEILAADGGTVLLSQWVDGYGNYVEIDHGNGFKTAYGHCSELLVSEGDLVTQGQIIATMGSTGNSTGPHLHFEVLLNGEPQNPLNYVMY